MKANLFLTVFMFSSLTLAKNHFDIQKINKDVSFDCNNIVISDYQNNSKELQQELTAHGYQFSILSSQQNEKTALEDGTLILNSGTVTSIFNSAFENVLSCNLIAGISVADKNERILPQRQVFDALIGINTRIAGVFNHQICGKKLTPEVKAQDGNILAKLLVDRLNQQCRD